MLDSTLGGGEIYSRGRKLIFTYLDVIEDSN